MKRKWQDVLAVLVFFCVLTLLPILSVQIQWICNKDNQKIIPKIGIFLGEATLDVLKYGEKGTIYGGNNLVVTDMFGEKRFTNVEIKGRGNTTWWADKKPYQIEFNNRTNLLGMAEGRKWVLLANVYDVGGLRNDLAFYFEKILDDTFVLEGRFVELSVDNDYQGVYYITPKLEISNNSVNISNQYGILMELENLRFEYEESGFTSSSGDSFVVSDSVNKDTENIAAKSFINQYDGLYNAAKNKDFDKIEQLSDVDSLAKYFILSEFSANPDAYSTSIFFYKDGLEDKIHMAPGWDFDLAFGNKKWDWGWHTDDDYSPYNTTLRRIEAFGGEKYDSEKGKMVTIEDDGSISKLFYYLIDMPEFEERVRRIYIDKMSSMRDDAISYLLRQIEYVRPAFSRDEARWETNEFQLDAEYLLDWVQKRFDFFEQTYGD